MYYENDCSEHNVLCIHFNTEKELMFIQAMRKKERKRVFERV